MNFNSWIAEKAAAIEIVELEPGVRIGIRTLTAAEFLALAKLGDDAGAAMIAAAARNEDGTPLFTTRQAVTASLPVTQFFAILKLCQKFNAVNVEEAAKN